MNQYFTESEIEWLGAKLRRFVRAGGTSAAWLHRQGIRGEKAMAVMNTILRRAINKFKAGFVPAMWRLPCLKA